MQQDWKAGPTQQDKALDCSFVLLELVHFNCMLFLPFTFLWQSTKVRETQI